MNNTVLFFFISFCIFGASCKALQLLQIMDIASGISNSDEFKYENFEEKLKEKKDFTPYKPEKGRIAIGGVISIEKSLGLEKNIELGNIVSKSLENKGMPIVYTSQVESFLGKDKYKNFISNFRKISIKNQKEHNKRWTEFLKQENEGKIQGIRFYPISYVINYEILDKEFKIEENWKNLFKANYLLFVSIRYRKDEYALSLFLDIYIFNLQEKKLDFAGLLRETYHIKHVLPIAVGVKRLFDKYLPDDFN